MTRLRITPPQELSPRIIPREAPHIAVEDSRRTAIQSAVIRWRDLALAAWQLAEDEQYTGRLPDGMVASQFWAKVTRAARAMGGEVGIAVRGRQWWVWGVKAGKAKAAEETRQRQREAAERGWERRRSRKG